MNYSTQPVFSRKELLVQIRQQTVLFFQMDWKVHNQYKLPYCSVFSPSLEPRFFLFPLRVFQCLSNQDYFYRTWNVARCIMFSFQKRCRLIPWPLNKVMIKELMWKVFSCCVICIYHLVQYLQESFQWTFLIV